MKAPQEKQPAPITGDEILRRMLNTPPKPQEAKPVVKKTLKATSRKGD